MPTDQTINNVCEKLFIARSEIFQKSRKRYIIDARRICINQIKLHNPGYTLKKIGKIFNIDHATVLHALKTYNELLKTDKEFQEKVKRINHIPITLIK